MAVFDFSFAASFTRDCVRACAEQLSQVVLQERKDVDDKVYIDLKNLQLLVFDSIPTSLSGLSSLIISGAP